jgi:hypothetical protein
VDKLFTVFLASFIVKLIRFSHAPRQKVDTLAFRDELVTSCLQDDFGIFFIFSFEELYQDEREKFAALLGLFAIVSGQT